MPKAVSTQSSFGAYRKGFLSVASASPPLPRRKYTTPRLEALRSSWVFRQNSRILLFPLFDICPAQRSADLLTTGGDFFSKTKFILIPPVFSLDIEVTGCRNRAISSTVKLLIGSARNSICLFSNSDRTFSLSSSDHTTFHASLRRISS